MKKMLSLALALAISCSMLLTGCGGGSSTSTPADTTNTPAASSGTADTFDWPKQPVNVMCPAAAGGGTDMILRLVNEYFTKETDQPLVITNITGVSGYEQTYQANPDGYNYICGTTTIFTSELDGTFDYDWDDYEMVAWIEGNYSTVIAVQADSPYQTFNDLLNAAKADPNGVTGGITLSGQPYMFAKALKDSVGVDLYYVDCGNTAERNAALLGGQVDYIITNIGSSQGYVDSGDFRFIAIDGEERYELAPDVPTFMEQGIDFCFAAQPMVWLAPEGTSAEACEAFNAILNKIYTNENFINDIREKMSTIVYPVPSVEESTQEGQAFADLLAPYVE